MVGHIVSGTGVITSVQATTLQGLGAGGAPCGVAVVLAIRRRACTTASGTLAAITQAATGAVAPIKRGGSQRGRVILARRVANSPGAPLLG